MSEHVVFERKLYADLMQWPELHLRACHAESRQQLCIPRPGAEHEGVRPQAHRSEIEFYACAAAHEAGADIRFMDELMPKLDGERLNDGRHIEHGFIQAYDEAFETALGQERGPVRSRDGLRAILEHAWREKSGEITSKRCIGP